jgi:hypothetical protein
MKAIISLALLGILPFLALADVYIVDRLYVPGQPREPLYNNQTPVSGDYAVVLNGIASEFYTGGYSSVQIKKIELNLFHDRSIDIPRPTGTFEVALYRTQSMGGPGQKVWSQTASYENIGFDPGAVVALDLDVNVNRASKYWIGVTQSGNIGTSSDPWWLGWQFSQKVNNQNYGYPNYSETYTKYVEKTSWDYSGLGSEYYFGMRITASVPEPRAVYLFLVGIFIFALRLLL